MKSNLNKSTRDTIVSFIDSMTLNEYKKAHDLLETLVLEKVKEMIAEAYKKSKKKDNEDCDDEPKSKKGKKEVPFFAKMKAKKEEKQKSKAKGKKK
ncbi:MAG: hypothetical protein RL728_623 [Bacteroidota bacterium]|jgi:hypothetical protein